MILDEALCLNPQCGAWAELVLNQCYLPHPLPWSLFLIVQKASLWANHSMYLDPSLLLWKMGPSHLHPRTGPGKIMEVGKDVTT